MKIQAKYLSLLKQFRLWSTLCIGLVFLCMPAGATIDAVWDGPASDNWNDPANWNSASVPHNGANNYNAWIGTLGTHTVQVDGSFTIDRLMVAPPGTVNIGTSVGQSLELVGTASTFDGRVRLTDHASYGGSANLIVSDLMTFDGNGFLDFATSGSNLFSGSGTATIGPNFTVQSQGTGSITVDTIVDGIIQTDGGTLSIFNNSTNNSIIQSIKNGNITLSGVTVQNDSGQILVESGSNFYITNSTVVGGTLAGGGAFNINGASIFDGTSGITLDPGTTVGWGTTNGESLTLKSDVVNNHELRLTDHPSYSGHADLFLEGTAFDPIVYFTGSGSIIFASSGSNRILASAGDPNAQLSLGSGQMVTTVTGGNGWIGAPVINDGTIEARGGTVAIASSVTNNNNLQSVAGGTVNLNSVSIQNGLGQVLVESGSTFNITDSSVVSGTLTGGGAFNVNGASVFDGTSGITLDPETTVGWGTTSGESLTAKVGVVNNHELRLTDHPSYSGYADLLLEGTQEDSVVYFTGTGSVIFASSGSNRILASAGDPDAQLSLGSGQTITTLLSGSNGSLNAPVFNAGIIEARKGIITINEDVTNNNLVQAVEGGTLNLTTLAVDNSSGTIIVDESSTLHLLNTTISGGQITGTGLINTGGTTSVLSGNAINLDGPTVTLGTTIGEALTLQGDISNSSTFRLEDHPSYGGAAELKIDGNVNLNGSGQVRFNSNGTNRLMPGGIGDSLIQGASHSIIAPGSNLGEIKVAMVNNGTVDADDGSITLNTESKTNNNLIVARNSGSLSLSTTIENDSGTITIDSTSQMTLSNGAIIRGGLIDGGGNINVNGTTAILDGSDITLDDVTISIGATGGESLNLVGNFINDATIQLLDHPSYGATADLNIIDDVNIQGAGSIRFASGGANKITAEDPNATLNIGSDQTVATGSSKYGYIYPKTTNQGTISAEGGPLTFYNDLTNGGDIIINGTTMTVSSSTLTNEPGGKITGSGTLNVSSSTFINNGTVSPGLSPGTLNVTGSYTQSETGSLQIEIGGATAGTQLDKLNVSGHADLDGTLFVAVNNGFAPSPGQTFEIMTYASHTGQFTDVVGLDCGGSDRFSITYGVSGITLTATDIVLPADFDGNKIVNIYDLSVFTFDWLNLNCAAPTWCNCADMDYSGRVDFSDFAEFAKYWLVDLN